MRKGVFSGGFQYSWIEGGSGVERLVYFSDAVFAIAITLLALEIRLPEMHGPTTRELAQALIGLLPHFYGFAISFWIIPFTGSPTTASSITSGPTTGGSWSSTSSS